MIDIVLIILLGIFTLISVYNLFTAPELTQSTETIKQSTLVSILIPARNEENKISKLIGSILKQTYSNTETLILDDNSDDNTFDVASFYQNENLKVYRGEQLPKEWLGKNWACHQLANKANGEYLLFLDADVELHPNTIESAVKVLENNNLSLVSVFPSQKIKSVGEFLIVPLMNWLLLTFLPLQSVSKSKNNAFVAANGQFMLWKKKDYLKIGGHQKVKNKIVEDMELARLVKQHHFKVKTLLGGHLVICRMYGSFNEAYNGFQKNFYAGFSINPILFLLMIVLLLVVFTSPLFYGFSLTGLLLFTFIIINRVSVSIISKQNVLINLFLHFIQMLLMFSIGILSVIKFKQKNLIWKSRKL